MIYVYILGISIFVVEFILKSAWFKGWFGELLVNLANLFNLGTPYSFPILDFRSFDTLRTGKIRYPQYALQNYRHCI